MAEPRKVIQHKFTTEERKNFAEKANPHSSVKKMIGVISGKGGVGKSMVSAMLARQLQKQGLHTGVLDADITGPSIPKAFGIHEHATGTQAGVDPVKSKGGVDVMSINLMLQNESDPVIWRGPIIAGTVKQFWSEVVWKDIDVLLVDMPPGTGDVALTVFQSLPIDGVIIVTSPQDLVSMIVEKAVNMTQMMNIPILGVVENMSYLVCPHCGEKINVFGDSHIDQIAKDNDTKVLAKVPMDPAIAQAMDKGEVESIDAGFLQGAVDAIKAL